MCQLQIKKKELFLSKMLIYFPLSGRWGNSPKFDILQIALAHVRNIHFDVHIHQLSKAYVLNIS